MSDSFTKDEKLIFKTVLFAAFIGSIIWHDWKERRLQRHADLVSYALNNNTLEKVYK